MKFLKFTIVYLVFITHTYAQITLAVAANVQFAMQQLKEEFKKETGIDASIIIGSSVQFTAQIKEGAPYDIFISADMKYPNSLYQSKLAINAPKVYASGSLVIWSVKKGIKFDNKLNFLLLDNIKRIAIANPTIAPYGEAAIEVLKHFNIYDKVKDKLVYGESISPTNQFIVSGAADAGFTAKSVVVSPQMKGKGVWMEIDPSVYSPIEQGCVILKYGIDHHKKDSIRFYNFLFSQKAKNILRNFGYQIIGN